MVRISSSAGCPSLGQAVRVRCLLVVGGGLRVWGPGTGSLACVPCGASRAAEVAGVCPGTGTSQPFEGRLVSGAIPLPAARPRGRQPGSAAEMLWARVCWRRVQPTGSLACRNFWALRAAGVTDRFPPTS